MKIVITEQQKETLEKTIIDFFDRNLTPFDGWDHEDEYKSELEINGGEVFIQTREDGEWNLNHDNHMWYSVCDNANLSEPLDEGHCPVVTLPRPVYDALNGYFGDNWKKLFRRWFMSNTGLVVVQIDTL